MCWILKGIPTMLTKQARALAAIANHQPVNRNQSTLPITQIAAQIAASPRPMATAFEVLDYRPTRPDQAIEHVFSNSANHQPRARIRAQPEELSMTADHDSFSLDQGYLPLVLLPELLSDGVPGREVWLKRNKEFDPLWRS